MMFLGCVFLLRISNGLKKCLISHCGIEKNVVVLMILNYVVTMFVGFAS